MEYSLKKDLQGLPPATTQAGQEVSITKEILAEDFGYAENEVTVGQGFQHLFTKPFPEFNPPFLVAGWTKMPSLA
jgi:hypothetical protein